MTFTVTYRGADGAPVTETVEAANRTDCLAQLKARGIAPTNVKEGAKPGRIKKGQIVLQLRPCGRNSDFFCFDVAENVVPKFLRSAKKLLLRTGKRNGGSKLKFHQMQCADEIGKLEQTIAGRFYAIHKLNLTMDVAFKYLVEHTSDRSLAAIVVYLDTLDWFKEIAIRKYEISEGESESIHHLVRGGHEFLVHAEAVVFVVNLAGKCHHARKDAAPQLSAQHGVVLFAADERSSMKAVSFEANFAVRAFKYGDIGRYVNGLLVENHADDVKTGFSVGDAEVPRFVHKYAQYFFFHSVSAQKREWRDTNPATHAESFPRIPVTPSLRKKSPRIIAKHECECNRVFTKILRRAA